jgi:hypothetical protein
MHAIAVEFDFVEPLIAVRRRVDQLGELRRDPFGQSGRDAAPARYRPRHAGNKLRRRRMRLVGAGQPIPVVVRSDDKVDKIITRVGHNDEEHVIPTVPLMRLDRPGDT